ncbi:MAG: undecaprenyldiphospho-muramoylpentapeptide beta-N-acetylglucosaminyltransferase [Owenweeksia sp.]|nr:undecaprenyldiphospho-muramoylpentapeptide beta-N-acetylglucosaminyltransferase [Owenweeksia sp.]
MNKTQTRPLMPKYRFMISGGGTGGHIFPAVAIADKLKEMAPGSEFLFVGASNRMEMERVPQAGYKITGLWISGIQRKLSLSNLLFPFKLLSSLAKCRRLISKFKPHAVIGTGGFASGPLLYVASGKGLPCLIQEQNSYPGITNKLLSKRVRQIAVAYDHMERFFPAEKIILTGNPIRENLKHIGENRVASLQKFKLNSKRQTLLILGGSLGARRINELIADNLKTLLSLNINLLWQTGKLYHKELEEKFGSRQSDQLQLMPFIQNMNDAFAADLVISRAGAGTISELAVARKAVMLIPSPNVAEDHQTKNAAALTHKGAAVLFGESGTDEKFVESVEKLITDQKQLEQNIGNFAKPDAADEIAREVLKMLEEDDA